MRVILQENIANLGGVGDQVSVKPGYGRNYLIPKGMAVTATPKNIEDFEKRRAELEKIAADKITAAKARAEKLASLTVKMEAQAGDEGKMFGSIGPRDVAEAVSAAGVELTKSEVALPEGPIRVLGVYDIECQLHSEVKGMVKVEVIAAK